MTGGAGVPIETGCVVKAVAGHDAQGYFAVVGVDEQFVLLADGRRRKLEKPKRKNICHIRKTNTRLDPTSLSTDKKLREALRAFQENEGGNSIV